MGWLKRGTRICLNDETYLSWLWWCLHDCMNFSKLIELKQKGWFTVDEIDQFPETNYQKQEGIENLSSYMSTKLLNLFISSNKKIFQAKMVSLINSTNHLRENTSSTQCLPKNRIIENISQLILWGKHLPLIQN